MPIKSKCCNSPIAAKCMKCEKMCEVVEHQTSTWSAHYGFPYYKTVGHLWWKKRVPNGWEDRGEVKGEPYKLPEDRWWTMERAYGGGKMIVKTDEKIAIHKDCHTVVHIGLEGSGPFRFCPKCLIKITITVDNTKL